MTETRARRQQSCWRYDHPRFFTEKIRSARSLYDGFLITIDDRKAVAECTFGRRIGDEIDRG